MACDYLETDVLVIGAGIQGMILAHELCKAGKRVICLEKNVLGGKQTLQSQFYLHRGHFYKDVDLARTLNANYAHWEKLFHFLNLPPASTKSYVGFNAINDEKTWVESWLKAKLPFSLAKNVPALLIQAQHATFYSFPHILFDGDLLIERLCQYLSPLFFFGSLTSVKINQDGSKKSVVQTNGVSREIISKHIVFCAGENNLKLIHLIESDDKAAPKIQIRSCQIMTLKGRIPNLSLVLPGLEMFLAPQYTNGEIHWLYTHGYDPLVMPNENEGELNTARIKKQVKALYALFPKLDKWVDPDASVYTARKIESADLGHGKRPNKAFVHRVIDGVFAIWPTKLALAFEAATEVINLMQNDNTTAGSRLDFPIGKSMLTNQNKHVNLHDYL